MQSILTSRNSVNTLVKLRLYDNLNQLEGKSLMKSINNVFFFSTHSQ